MQKFTTINRIADAADTLKDFKASTDTKLQSFGSKNLIYGYNGAGKTTISRIFSYIGTGKQPHGLNQNFTFEFGLEGGGEITNNSDLAQYKSRIFVYNEDYIEQNFAWNTGTAQPIFGLGEKNIADVESLNSARSERDKLAEVLATKKSEQQTKVRAFETFCRDTARNVEQRVYKGRSFDARKLKVRYDSNDFDPGKTLTQEELEQAEQILNQPAPTKITGAMSPIPDILDDTRRIFPLLARSGRQIKLSELSVHSEMENWVKHGYEYHKGNDVAKCIFCGKEITEERFDVLAAHFSDEINRISQEATSLKDTFAGFRRNIEEHQNRSPAPDQFGVWQRSKYVKVAEERKKLAGDLGIILERFEELLLQKLSEPATAREDVGAVTLPERFKVAYDSYSDVLIEQNKLIEKHNAFVDDFDQERDTAKERIASHLLADNYPTYKKHFEAQDGAKKLVAVLEAKVRKCVKDIEAKEAALHEHASAAPELNKEIEAFLRHAHITLKPVDEGYQLLRADGTPVRRLSEGEKTAITFCYFITSIEAEDRKLKDVIIVVDDPISSLDTRALTYMASLIRTRLCDAEQLFVFTHNTPFMSEMRKWMYPRSMMQKAKRAQEEGKSEPNIPLFHLNLRYDNSTKKRWATLENMSKLLRDYEGEYHYLYSVVYSYAKQPNPATELFLLLPNAIRKVMETYLLFKLPNNNNFSSAIEQMAKDIPNKPRYYALRKFAEMEGHSEDLASITQPAVLTIEEAHPAAQELMDLIEATDKMHADQMRKLCDKHPAS